MKPVIRTCFSMLAIALLLLFVAFTAPIIASAIATTSAIHSVVAGTDNPECLGVSCGAPSQEGNAAMSLLHGIADNNNPECLGSSCGSPNQE